MKSNVSIISLCAFSRCGCTASDICSIVLVAQASLQQMAGQESAPGPTPERAPNAQPRKLRNSCDACQEAKLGCSQEKPSCRRCSRYGHQCVYSPFRRIGRPPRSFNAQGQDETASKPRSKAQNRDGNNSSNSRVPTTQSPSTHDSSSSAVANAVVSTARSPISIDHSENSLTSLFSLSADPFPELNSHFDSSSSALDGLDSFLSGQDFTDAEPHFGDEHNLQMTALLSNADSAVLDPQQLMNSLSAPSSSTNILSSGKANNSFSEHAFPSNPQLASARISHQPQGWDEPGAPPTPGMTSGTSHPDPMDFEIDSDHAWSFGCAETRPNAHSEQTGATAIDASSASTPRPMQTSSTQGSCRTNCYPSLVHQLSLLNSQISEGFKPGLDVILQVERDTRSLRDKILGCKTCFHNRSIFLLISMVIEQVMRLLETIAPDENELSSPQSLNNGVSSSPSVYQCDLIVGEYRVHDYTRASFVKRHLLFRFGRFSKGLMDLGGIMSEDRKDVNLKAAKDVLRDVFQRMEILRGVVELWE